MAAKKAAEIRTRKRDGITVLVVYWRDSKGKRHTAFGDGTTLFGPDTPEARERAEVFRASLAVVLPSSAHSITLQAYTKIWLDRVQTFVKAGSMAEPTLDVYKRVLRLSVINNWIGKRTLAELTRGDVKAWATEMMKPKDEGGMGYKVGSVRLLCSVLRNCLKEAIEDGDAPPGENPAMGMVKAMKLRRPPDDVARHAPTVEVTAALIGAVHDRSKPAFMVMTFLGLRIGEALGLQWTDVDLADGTVRIERQVYRSGKIAPPKSDAGYRVVDVPDAAVEILRMMKVNQAREALAAGRTPTIWVLDCEPKQNMYIRHRLFRDWRTAAKKIGYKGRVWLHGVRHTYGTGRVEIGGEKTLLTLNKAMGHASIGITIGLYAKHAKPRDKRNADQYGQRVTGTVVPFPAEKQG